MSKNSFTRILRLEQKMAAFEKMHEEAIISVYKAAEGFNQCMGNITALYRKSCAMELVLKQLGVTDEQLVEALKQVDADLAAQLEAAKQSGGDEAGIEAIKRDAEARWRRDQERQNTSGQ